MDDEARRRFNRAHISQRDFEKALYFIDEAEKHCVATIVYEALLIAAITQYAKPFSGNERGKSPPSDSRLEAEVAAVLVEDLPLHLRILDMRNQAVAHSEFAKYPVSLLPTPPGTETAGFATTSKSWHVLNEHIDLEAFRRMSEVMRRKCISICFDIGVTRQPPAI